MKLKFLTLLGLVFFALGACTEQAPNHTDSQTASSPETASEINNKKNPYAPSANLKLYNWSDYIDPKALETFNKRNNVKVDLDIFDSDETLEAKVLTGHSGYDIVFPSNTFVGRQIQAGAYQKINKDLIRNYALINPKLLQLMSEVDPGNEYAVPYVWGLNTFAINETKVKKALGDMPMPEKLWDLVFDPQYTEKLAQCGISYLDSAAEMYPMALHYLNLPTNNENLDDIQAATDLMMRNRPNIKRFTSSGFMDSLARGDVCVAVGWGGNLNIAKERAKEVGNPDVIRVLMPKEGMGIWVDTMTIPVDSANVFNAHRFIDFTLDPNIGAQNGNFTSFSPASMPSQQLMDPKFANDPVVFPSDEDLANSFIMVPIQPAIFKTMMRQWQDVRTGKSSQVKNKKK